MVVNRENNNKRIAKNTLLLYLRMFFIMAVTLYTSRIILQALGVIDFGIYNVVGGVVAMFGFINGSLSNASSRFITYEIGKGIKEESKKTFNSIVTIHYLLAIVLFILAETIGLWFVENKLVIPAGRMTAAFWVYQSSVVSSIIMLASTPFNALIIAYEKMSAFAYISILEVVARLLIVVLLFIIPYDRLIIYAVLIVFVQLMIRLIYVIYCRKHFEESAYSLIWDKNKSYRILSYAGWTINGNIAYLGSTQGLNILLNMFFGPVVNAARGISVQVQSAVNQFFANFQVAVNPQITKTYAQGEIAYMHKLVLSSSRYSFYLMLLVSLPVLFQTDYILQLWLGQVPEHTVAFLRIMIVVGMNYSLSGPVVTAVRATGDIKKYQIIEGSLLLLIFPVAYILLKFFHVQPEEVLLVYLLIEVCTQFVRVWIVYPKIGLLFQDYIKKVMFPICKVCLLVWIIPYYALYLCNESQNLFSLLVVTIACLFSVGIWVPIVGLYREERSFLYQKIFKLKK